MLLEINKNLDAIEKKQADQLEMLEKARGIIKALDEKIRSLAGSAG